MPHERDHEKKSKPHPKPNGPKERELAVALTVAALGVAKIDEPLAVVAQLTLEVYGDMLRAVRGPGSNEPADERDDHDD